MISILLPSRGRPAEFKRMWESAIETGVGELEFVVYRDKDDAATYEYPPHVQVIDGERIVLSQMWNECAKLAKGDILMHAGDDIVFRTEGWDKMVEDEFAKYADRILFVHGDDDFHGDKFGTHGFVSREWMDVLGYFVPPYFSSDFNDTWLNDVANMIQRREYVPILTEHMHWTFNKGPLDETHRERIQRHHEDKVEHLYDEKLPERIADAKKLQRYIDSKA